MEGSSPTYVDVGWDWCGWRNKLDENQATAERDPEQEQKEQLLQQ